MNPIDFLFNTPQGVAILVFGGMALFVVIAFVLERKTHKMYYNHEPEETDDDWEDEDDDWDDDDEDDEKDDEKD